MMPFAPMQSSFWPNHAKVVSKACTKPLERARMPFRPTLARESRGKAPGASTASDELRRPEVLARPRRMVSGERYMTLNRNTTRRG